MGIWFISRQWHSAIWVVNTNRMLTCSGVLCDFMYTEYVVVNYLGWLFIIEMPDWSILRSIQLKILCCATIFFSKSHFLWNLHTWIIHSLRFVLFTVIFIPNLSLKYMPVDIHKTKLPLIIKATVRYINIYLIKLS